MRPSVSYVCAIAVGGVLSAKPFTTPVAERPDEPVPSGAMPADWREYPFVDAVAEPSFTAREREDGFLVFSRPITEPVYRETRPQAGERVESLHAFAARGERAQLNFAVYPGRDIVGFAAVAETPFAARLEQVTYAPFVYDHYQVRGKYRIGPAYLVPSARTPLRRGEPLRYVLTMRVPKDAAPGRHHGVVRLGDALRQTVRELPFSLDVLPFELKSDPNRFRTAYVNRYYDVAGTVEYGFNIPGTIYVNHDAEADRLFAADLDEIEAKWLAAGGRPPRRYIALFGFVGKLYRHYTGKAYAKNATPMPPDAFFDHIGRLGRTFLDEWKAKGRPELFVIGADEPYPSSAPYVSRLFRTLKDAGFRLFVTSWSARDPKLEAALSPYVDVWCDQYFVSPAELEASGKAEHWCYPNHNAFEIKDAPTQSRGGRMTWGFGAWKMADTTIVPWAWSWNSAPLRKAKIPQLADGLAAPKPDGTEWVSWFWEAIFAGAVDGDIYTLQDAVLRRGGPAEAKALLQELYDSVPAEPKYLAANHWGDAMFDSARARVAAMIVEAARLAETNAAAECPSVLPCLKWHPGKAEALDFLAREERAGRLVRRPVPPTAFYPSEDECRVRAEADGSVHCTISVDFERAGNPAGYKCGSPSLMARLASGKDGELDVTPYAFLSYEMRVRSNRCADDAAKWPHTILFTSRTADGGTVTKGLSGVPCNLAADQWHSIMIPLSGLGLSDEEKAHVISMRWYFLERDYSHGDVLELDVRNASLIGVGKPLLISLAPFVSWAGAMEVRWRAQIVGDIPASGVPARVRLRDAAGGIVAEAACDLRHADAKGALRLSAPPPYMAIDLDKTAGKTPQWYPDEGSLPEGIESDVYRTDKMVLRKIPARGVTWRMGSPEGEIGRDTAMESNHLVRLTHDYYLGVFEVTQAQLKRVYGKNGSYYQGNADDWATRPAENCQFAQIRDNGDPTSDSAATRHASEGWKFFGMLRTFTGLGLLLDLPTEAQWEYACRAESLSALYDGSAMATNELGVCEALDALGRYARNGGLIDGKITPDFATCGTDAGTARVGSYRPNAWGFYDMLGNVAELCMDMYNYYEEGIALDPAGPARDKFGIANNRALRGGSWKSAAADCRCASRSYSQMWVKSDGTGFRVCYTIR